MPIVARSKTMLILVQTFAEPMFGYWDGGAKRAGKACTFEYVDGGNRR